MQSYIACGDCLELMRDIPDGSVDMILCDLPYGTTRNKWDSVIPLDALWAEYERIIHPLGAIVLFAQFPFAAALCASNPKLFKYEWVWEKTVATGYLNARFAPMKAHENILVFSKGCAAQTRYVEKAMKYRPQYAEGKPYRTAVTDHGSKSYDKISKPSASSSDGERFPRDVVKFNRETGLHPTQKPVPLCEYLIRTYTDKGDVVLDNCMGSGTTCVAAVRTGRKYIGIERERVNTSI